MSESAPSAAEPAPSAPSPRRSPAKKWIVSGLILLLAVFVLQNRGTVRIDFVFAETETPLVWGLLIAAGIGALVGFLGPRLRSNKKH